MRTFTHSAHKCTPTAHSCWQLYQIFLENATCFCKFFIGTCRTGKRCRRYAGICLCFCSISLNRLQERMIHSIGFAHQAGKLKFSTPFVGRGLDPADHVTKCTRLDEWDNVMIFDMFPVVISEKYHSIYRSETGTGSAGSRPRPTKHSYNYNL